MGSTNESTDPSNANSELTPAAPAPRKRRPKGSVTPTSYTTELDSRNWVEDEHGFRTLAPGNDICKLGGYPFKKQEKKAIAQVKEWAAANPGKVLDVILKFYELAMHGNVEAGKEFLNRTIGKVKDEIEIDTNAAPPIFVFQSDDGTQVVLGGPPPTQPPIPTAEFRVLDEQSAATDQAPPETA